MRHALPFLLIASLLLTACASSQTPLAQPTKVPPLASDLAQPCATLTAPTALDYDAWLYWITQTVLPAYAICKARHASTVAAWPVTP